MFSRCLSRSARDKGMWSRRLRYQSLSSHPFIATTRGAGLNADATMTGVSTPGGERSSGAPTQAASSSNQSERKVGGVSFRSNPHVAQCQCYCVALLRDGLASV